MISQYHNNPLAGHFRIEKTRELVVQKYYWPTLKVNVETYVKGCNICLASKSVRHKLYGDLQSLLVPMHQWKDLSMDFVTGLLVSTNWKGETYDSILVIINRLTKTIYYKSVKITINTPGLAEVIIKTVVQYHGLLDSIVSDYGSVFTSKFLFSLCYFLEIKQKLSTAFYPQIDGQIKKQNSIMEVYFQVFVNYK